MRHARFALTLAALATAAMAAAAPRAAAGGLDEGQARSKIGAAGYADVTEVHEGNLGEWMAQASKDGRPVMVVVYPDGRVALRQEIATPPALPVPGLNPAKP